MKLPYADHCMQHVNAKIVADVQLPSYGGNLRRGSAGVEVPQCFTMFFFSGQRRTGNGGKFVDITKRIIKGVANKERTSCIIPKEISMRVGN